MDTKKVEYFISLAKWRNFTIAAEKNFISQSAFSKAIGSLECELKVKLFHRLKTVVTLTEEGKALLQTAQELLQKERNLCRQAQTLSIQGVSMLKIGYFDYWEYPFLCSAVSRFSELNPYTELTFEQGHHGLLNRGIQLGNYDIILTLDCKNQKNVTSPDIEWMSIAESLLYVFVSESSSLSNRTQLELKDLTGERQIIVSRQQESIFNSIINKAFIEEGVECHYHPFSPLNSKDMLLMVLANEGYNLSTYWWGLSDIPGLRIIPLKSSIPPVEFGVAYRKSIRKVIIDSFLECIKKAFADCLIIPDSD